MTAGTIRQWVWAAVAGVACGGLGWTTGHSTAPAASEGLPHPSTVVASHAPLEPGPSIVVTQDGAVTAHVDRRPLGWVLAELHRQAGAARIDQTEARGHADACGARSAPTSAAVAAGPGEIASRIMRGTEAERYNGLLEAQNSGLVSDAMLRTLYETDASPRVRLLAFDYSLEGTEADPAARRSALEAATLLPDAVVAQEAARLLEAMPRDEPGHHGAPQISPQRYP